MKPLNLNIAAGIFVYRMLAESYLALTLPPLRPAFTR
jgi:hypothetical protein